MWDVISGGRVYKVLNIKANVHGRIILTRVLQTQIQFREVP